MFTQICQEIIKITFIYDDYVCHIVTITILVKLNMHMSEFQNKVNNSKISIHFYIL